MKRILVMLLMIVAATLLGGCSGSSKPADDPAPTASVASAGQPDEPEQLPVYETMKEYRYDIDGNQTIDNFSLETDGMNYVNLFINEWGYRVALEDITPELLYRKYKLVKIDGSNKCAFALYVASPPSDYEVYLYNYEDKGYDKSESGKKESEELKEIGVATIDLKLFNYDYPTLFDSEVQLSRDQVTIGGHKFTFDQ